jgi:hypothetical protein
MDQFEKQSREIFPIWGSILNVQETTEVVTLAGSTVTAMDKDGKDAGEVIDQSSIILADDPDGSYSDNMLGIKVRDGEESKSPYYITFLMATDNGNKWEVDVKMKVKNTPTVTAVSTTTTTV